MWRSSYLTQGLAGTTLSFLLSIDPEDNRGPGSSSRVHSAVHVAGHTATHQRFSHRTYPGVQMFTVATGSSSCTDGQECTLP